MRRFVDSPRTMMPPTPFAPGQRWVSNTEAELGLGIVSRCDARRVTVSFPAGGQERTYAVDGAPLSRIEYSIGDSVKTAGDLSITVTAVLEHAGRLVYAGTTEAGESTRIDELELDSFVAFSTPEKRLLAGQIDSIGLFELRAQTLHHRHRLLNSSVYGLLGPRVQLLPHQLYIAAEVASRYAPRVLLADEVGLGKTIESGLIVHQQLATGRASRVLILVPDSLVHQWLVEMLRRFNLGFMVLDEERCEALAESGTQNPFEAAQLVLCSLALVVNQPLRLEQALASGWDMLVVDEAHHLQWSEERASPQYAVVEALAAKASGVLLLTGTPEQLGLQGHFARLRLLDPERYPDLEAFIRAEDGFAPVNTLVQAMLAGDAAEMLKAHGGQIAQYLGDEVLSELTAALGTDRIDVAIRSAVDGLADRHGTGRVLFRNTRDELGGFPGRRLVAHPLPAPECHGQAAPAAGVEDLLQPERLLGDGWLGADPRVEWLATWLTERRDRKTLIICARASTALELEQRLRLHEGARTAVFHEGLTLIARDRAAAYFADDDEGAQALICSEIGSEGRNFQFASDLVLFDLPLNPDLLEQRIGRLDRIGQMNEVQIHVPYYQGSAQDVLLRWYQEGIDAIERSCSIGERLYRELEEPLHASLHDPSDTPGVEALIERTKVLTSTLSVAFEQGRNRLLELNSCRPARADEVIGDIVEATRGDELAGYMERVFDRFGVEQEHHSAHSVVLRPGDHMLVHNFPGLPEDGTVATYSRTKALSREDMQFMTWEHPMVSGAMDLIVGGEFGNTALYSLKLAPLKPGSLLVEFHFVLHCPAPRGLQVERFMPQASIRIVIDDKQRDLSAALTSEHVNRLAQKVPLRMAQQLVRHFTPQLKALTEHATGLAGNQRARLVAEARECAGAQHETEHRRLVALAQINPSVRPEEIRRQVEIAESLQDHIARAYLQLDALRVGVTV
ncbi:MAG: RNA polymerase-associated protein RapA [Gammaproteobacteria bacterium]